MSPADERDEGSAPQPVLTVAAVARRLGVAPSTLRTWDRRYDLGPSTHTAGSHRRYSVNDLARLVVMRGLVQEGVPPAEAAQIALTAPASSPPDADRWPSGRRLGQSLGSGVGPGLVEKAQGGAALLDDAVLEGLLPPFGEFGEFGEFDNRHDQPGQAEPDPLISIPVARSEAEWGEHDVLAELSRGLVVEPDAEPRDPDQAVLPAVVSPGHRRVRSWSTPSRRGLAARHGGGRVVALPDGSPQARGLARAAMSLDTPEVARLFRSAVHAYGVVSAWEAMAMPVLQAIGDRWQATGEGIDVEHAFSEALISVLHGVTDSLGTPRNTCPVLLTCADGEQHSIPMHVLAAALAEIGIGCRMFGEGMPPSSLIAAVRRIGPAVVFLYARLPVGDCAVLDELPRQRPAPRVVLGGPGWNRARVAGSVPRVDALGPAVVEVVSGVHL
jgi:DNA-binding transcriptional MerR regulator/methanogenic corrinoid protein MtbC1